MIERTKKAVKQLQTECKKRKIGFMMNWTKAALIKRLEDEDKREDKVTEIELKAKREVTELESKAEKAEEIAKTLKAENKKLKPRAIEKKTLDDIKIKYSLLLKDKEDNYARLEVKQKALN